MVGMLVEEAERSYVLAIEVSKDMRQLGLMLVGAW